MYFIDCMLLHLAYSETGAYTLARLHGWWTIGQRHQQAQSIVRSIAALDRRGLLEVYTPVPGRNFRYLGGRRVDLAGGTEEVLARQDVLDRDGWQLVATPAGENQIDLAQPSAEVRARARAFSDPEYVADGSWGDGSLWPNVFAREVARRISVAVGAHPRDVALDLDDVQSRFDAFCRSIPEPLADPEVSGALTLEDVLCGSLLLGDRRGIARTVRAIADRGVAIPSASLEPWTIATLDGLELWQHVVSEDDGPDASPHRRGEPPVS